MFLLSCQMKVTLGNGKGKRAGPCPCPVWRGAARVSLPAVHHWADSTVTPGCPVELHVQPSGS